MKKIYLGSLLILAVAIIGCGSSGSSGPDTSDPNFNKTDAGDFDGDGIANAQDTDDDNDGTIDTADCNTFDATINPDAKDQPDDKKTDSNCDGFDGNLSKSIWVATDGNDSNTGTIDAPVLTITHAIDLAKADPANIKDVYVVEGTYAEDVEVTSNVNLFGGFGTLADGKRERNISAHVTKITGVDNNKKLSITVNGAIMPPINYTVYLNSSNSTLDGFTVEGDLEGGTMFVNNSTAIIANSHINENIPTASRKYGIGIAILIDPSATEDHIVSVIKSTISMEGTFACTGDEFDYGILAIPQDNATKTLTVNVTGSEILSKHTTCRAAAILLADKDDNPNDDPLSDGKADLNLVARNNHIKMTGSYTTIVMAIDAGRSPVGDLMENFNYVNSFEASGNFIEIETENFSIGLVVGFARKSATIANNVVWTNGTLSGSYGVSSTGSSVNIYNNTIVTEGLLGSYALMATANKDTYSLNYMNNRTQKIINNIVYSKSTGSCVVFAEMTGSGDTPEEIKSANSVEFKNNNLYFAPDCNNTISALYADTQKLVKNNIDDLNNKVGFAADDDTVFANNISSNPNFVNAITGDFKLADGSTSINAGLTLTEITTDIDGTSRPAGTSYDIGAFEQ